MLIDTHCHLNFHAFNKDLDEVLTRAKNEGVEKIIIPGAKLNSSQKAIEIANKYDNCYVAVGVHPHHVEELKNFRIKELTNKLEELAKRTKVVAIGECGLDYHEYQKTVYDEYRVTPEIKEIQKELLVAQMEVAVKLNFPIIFHCRDAFVDMFSMISNFSTSHKLHGVFHCFGGTTKDLKKVLRLGFYVGYDGNITYKNAQNLRDLVNETPMDKILVETDAPFLAPEPCRGERNEPKNVKIIAEMIAKIKNIDLEKVIERTTKNTELLFNI